MIETKAKCHYCGGMREAPLICPCCGLEKHCRRRILLPGTEWPRIEFSDLKTLADNHPEDVPHYVEECGDKQGVPVKFVCEVIEGIGYPATADAVRRILASHGYEAK